MEWVVFIFMICFFIVLGNYNKGVFDYLKKIGIEELKTLNLH